MKRETFCTEMPALVYAISGHLASSLFMLSKARFTLKCEQNASVALKNNVNIRCRRVTKVRQMVFGYATNVQ